jgi:hypothetical protein
VQVIDALVFINCTHNQIANVKSAVDLIEGVIEAHSISGIYDIIIKVKSEGQESVAALKGVISRIKKINGVASLATHIVLQDGNYVEKSDLVADS